MQLIQTQPPKVSPKKIIAEIQKQLPIQRNSPLLIETESTKKLLVVQQFLYNCIFTVGFRMMMIAAIHSRSCAYLT